MEAVNEFNKLLKIDLDKFRVSLNEPKSLEAINREFEKLNRQLFPEQIVEDPSDLNCINVESDISCPEESIHPGIDGNVKTFDDLVAIKLQLQDAPNPTFQSKQSPENSIKKRPFLKKGEGLRRFSKGNDSSPINNENVAASLKWNSPNKDVGKVRKEPTEKKNVEMSMLHGHGKETISRTETTGKCTKNRSDFARKVMPISTMSTNSYPKHPGFHGPKNIQSLQTNAFSSEMTAEIYSNEMDIFTSRTVNNKLDQVEKSLELRERQTKIQEQKESFHIRKQIEDLEKRLLDLMTLKGRLTTRNDHESCSDKNSLSELALSLELIKKEISTLNSKVLSLSKLSPKEGVKREDAQINLDAPMSEDKNSRHFGPTEESSESDCSTLSNGDKIIIGSDQSITYIHLNGVSQTLYQDGMKVIRFPNGQVEKVHKNGTKQIIYGDGQQRLIKPDKSEELVLSDGRVFSISDDYEKIEYQNGDVEWKTSAFTRRHFSNGNIKTVYSNGCIETLFNNGRLRMKDKHGTVLFDSYQTT